MHEKAWRTRSPRASARRRPSRTSIAAELYERAIAAAGASRRRRRDRARARARGARRRVRALRRLRPGVRRARRRRASSSAPTSRSLDARLLGKQSIAARARAALRTRRSRRATEGLDAARRRRRRGRRARRRSRARSSSTRRRSTTGRRDNEEAIRWLEAAAEHAERAGDRSTLAHAYYLLDAAHSDFGSPDGLRYLELARPIYEELGDVRGLGVVLSTSASTPTTRAAGTSRSRSTARAATRRSASGDVIGAVIQVNNEAEILSDQGRVDEAMPLFEEMLRVSRASGWTFGAGRRALEPRRGRPHALDASRRRIRFSTRRSRCSPSFRRSASRSRRRRGCAECLVFEGRYREALEVATECREAAAKSPVGGVEALIERSIGYAHHQARQPRGGDGRTSRRACASRAS